MLETVQVVETEERVQPGFTCFRTSQGVFLYSERDASIYDCLGNSLVIVEVEKMRYLLSGNVAAQISDLREILIANGIISQETGIDSWQDEIQVLGETIRYIDQQRPWLSNLFFTRLDDRYIVGVFNPEGEFLRLVEISEEQFDLFYANPLDKVIFSNHSDKEIDLPDLSNLSGSALESVNLAKVEAWEYPLLTVEGEAVLVIRMVAGDEDAMYRLLRSNMRLVWKYAKYEYERFSRKVSLIELVQQGYIGLHEGIKDFNITRCGTTTSLGKLSTSLTYKIRRKINRFVIYYVNDPKVPEHEFRFTALVHRTKERFLRLGLPCGARDMAIEIYDTGGYGSYKTVLARVKAVLTRRDPKSLEEPIGDDGDAEFRDLVPSDEEGPECQVEDMMLVEAIRSAIESLNLTDRDRFILESWFGVNGRGRLTLEEIGGKTGLGRERVRQIAHGILSRLRHPTHARELRHYLEGIN